MKKEVFKATEYRYATNSAENIHFLAMAVLDFHQALMQVRFTRVKGLHAMQAAIRPCDKSGYAMATASQHI